MLLRTLGLLLLLAGASAAHAQRAATTSDAPLSERRVTYTIDARLDADTRTVHGTERITWRNPDAVPVSELQFHLYLNAFRDMRSTFMREGGHRHRGFEAGGDSSAWGGVEVTRLVLEGDTADLAPALRFIQPDDDNPDDRTVASLRLPRAVAPGETVALELDFTARLPKVFARTGWQERPDGSLFFMVAQWFPKLGVYEVPGQRYVPADAPRGAWSTHQFHANSEFYADFGTYDVTLDVPAAYRVGATGVRVAEEDAGERRRLTYRAEDVHDFAWTTSPAFEVHTDRWQHVELRLLLLPEHAAQAERHFAAAKVGLEGYGAWLGEYPYTTLTLVDAPGGAGGMEYPTLITCGTVHRLPAWFRPLELVTIHEFGHQYFYGLLASNEAEEAWLDEGFNSYIEARVMDDAYGPGAVIDLPGFRVGGLDYHRLAYTRNHPSRGALYTRSWEYEYPGDYGKNSYSKPAVVLTALERHLGEDVMRRVMRTYADRWRFRHPTTRDFVAVAEEVSGQELDWFFDQYVYGTAVVDYEVAQLVNVRQADDAADGVAEADSAAAPRYEARIRLHRKADGVFPQTLRVRFADGTTEDVRWDGQDRWAQFTFDRRVEEAHLDPDDAVVLDVNRLDNRRVADPDYILARKQQLKATAWLQALLMLF